LSKRTRSPSISARGGRSTSARQGRSLEGGMKACQITTPANTPANVHRHLGRRTIHRATMAKMPNAIARISRPAGQGRFE
jgi:hypothetical protein